MMNEKFNKWIVFRESIDKLKKICATIPLNEASDSSHYSVEVNYRTSKKEVMEAFVKLVLGYVSAAIKRSGKHSIKQVFSDNPPRILISLEKQWKDKELIAVLCYNNQEHSFVLSAGHWNNDRKTVSILEEETKKIKEESAKEIVEVVDEFLEHLKKSKEKYRKPANLNPAPQKRGPKS